MYNIKISLRNFANETLESVFETEYDVPAMFDLYKKTDDSRKLVWNEVGDKPCIGIISININYKKVFYEFCSQ